MVYTGQKQDIWNHLRKTGNITPLESLDLYGCYRLGSIIHRLRGDGHRIKTIIAKTKKGSQYAKYFLVDIKQLTKK